MSVLGYRIFNGNIVEKTIVGHLKRKDLNKLRSQGLIIKKICKKIKSKKK